MAATFCVRPNRLSPCSPPLPRAPFYHHHHHTLFAFKTNDPWAKSGVSAIVSSSPRRLLAKAGSRADDSAPSEMSVENALKLLGIPDDASFEDILRAKNSILAACKGDSEVIAQVEAAYDMLLMRSLNQRRAGKVASTNIRYADVKPTGDQRMGSAPLWLQTTLKNAPFSIETPSTGDMGLQAGVYGAMMVLTYVNGSTTNSSVPYAGEDVPGLILATSFGASLYFMTKNNVKLGKATIITIGGLVAGAVVGSAVENWLQVDVVPFLGLHSPAAIEKYHSFPSSSLHPCQKRWPPVFLPTIGAIPPDHVILISCTRW